MMLRKRSRAIQRDQMPDSGPESGLSGARNTLFSVPGLFVGFNPKCLSDCDSARSPTSPLDYKLISNLSTAFVRSPIGSEPPRKSWDSDRVGLGLVDSLTDHATNHSGLGKVGGVFSNDSKNKNIIFGSNMRINVQQSLKTCLVPVLVSSPKSLPKNYVVSSPTMVETTCAKDETECEPVKNQSYSADIGWTLSVEKGSSLVTKDVNFGMENRPVSLTDPLDHAHELIGMLSASEIENSEDYTRIITRGPNPKTTHIFGDCILESHGTELSEIPANQVGEVKKGTSWMVKHTTDLSEAEDFLSFCYFCKRKLVEGEDIYIYRGEKAFCSCNCREKEILNDEIEKPEMKAKATYDEEIFLAIDQSK